MRMNGIIENLKLIYFHNFIFLTSYSNIKKVHVKYLHTLYKLLKRHSLITNQSN